MIITAAAKAQALAYLVSKDTSVKSLTLRLFANNYSLTDTTTATNLVEVSAGNGYAPIALTGSSWSAGTSGTNLTYPQQTWTFTGPVGNIYGYYVTDSSGTLMFAETFPTGPYNVQNNSDVINVNITLQMA